MLIVGVDGLIGSALYRELSNSGHEVLATSRSLERQEHIQFDLLKSNHNALLASKPKIAYLCAAITNMSACEADPAGTAKTNVAASVALAGALMAAGVFVVFISSNTVFDGSLPWPDEEAAYSPTTEYGRQKTAAESLMRNLPGADENLAIVRLTKAWSPHSGMGKEFLARMRAGSACRAFSDLVQSPVSVSYVVASLAQVGEGRIAGTYHISGDVELSYSDFAMRLAQAMGVASTLVESAVSSSVGVQVLFKPKHPGLAMTHSRHRLGLKPEPMNDVLQQLLA